MLLAALSTFGKEVILESTPLDVSTLYVYMRSYGSGQVLKGNVALLSAGAIPPNDTNRFFHNAISHSKS
ncbi:MAG: hypothetical protein OYM47_12005 [Gemmatimonadota bacterium]|nr:hypothetical protein [Gemmatimonadota bacterium]